MLERGQLLSGGQKARVAIARAFVRNAPILVLDEPTAALDSRAEKEIQTAIDSLEEGRTVICIAHRLSTLANMDEIIVLDHGRIVERGTFEELLKAKGHFAKMAEQQRLTAAS
jgi:ATP-binding cassette, subfamily B, bacterial MsbA